MSAIAVAITSAVIQQEWVSHPARYCTFGDGYYAALFYERDSGWRWWEHSYGALGRVTDGIELDATEWPSWSRMSLETLSDGPRGESACGLPFVSLRCEWWGQPLGASGQDLRGGAVVRPPGRTMVVIPLLPIWPGLAFNTLFYALLWWLALASVRMVKHNCRHRRGLCPLCRYDLRADYSQGCSECGWRR